VSDWKWFIQAIVFGNENPVHVDIDVTFFDTVGISSMNMSLRNQETLAVLNSLIPARILADYKANVFENRQMRRLKRHPWAYKLVWFLERCLFKWEKWTKPRKKMK
jgi:hypothetical protein